MKKIIAVSLMAFTTALSLGTSSTAEAKWYAGAGAAWKSAQYKGSLGSQNLALNGDLYSVNGDLSGNDFFGALFAGHTFERSNFNWFVQANGAMDFGSKVKKTLTLPGASGMERGTISVERLGTAGVDLGIGKEFKGVNVSLKAGLLMGCFNMRVQDSGARRNFSTTSNVYVPGFAPGVGIEKKFGAFDVGIKYEYQMYKQVKAHGVDTVQDNSITTIANPRYHVMALTVKKEF
jgi:hypothetical protein